MRSFSMLLSRYRLQKFYLQLPINEKALFEEFSQGLADYITENSGLTRNRARFLWMVGANAVPRGQIDFALKVLQKARDEAQDPEDLAHIHANLAQILLDKENPTVQELEECNEHLLSMIGYGHMVVWAKAMLYINYRRMGDFAAASAIYEEMTSGTSANLELTRIFLNMIKPYLD